jgi:hypothetical protein
MKRFQKPILIFMAAALFTVTTFTVQAFAGTQTKAPTAEAMAADLLVLRPLGLVTTVLGIALYTVALPLTAWSRERMDKAEQRFIIDPAVYTFVRPLGEFNNN